MDEDEIRYEILRIVPKITGPNGLKWRVTSSADERAYCVWRFATYFGGQQPKWPTLAVKLLFDEAPEIRKFVLGLSKLISKEYDMYPDMRAIEEIEDFVSYDDGL